VFQQRFFSWCHFNKLDRQCSYCTYVSYGFHDRMSHLQDEHEAEYEKFIDYMGLK